MSKNVRAQYKDRCFTVVGVYLDGDYLMVGANLNIYTDEISVVLVKGKLKSVGYIDRVMLDCGEVFSNEISKKGTKRMRRAAKALSGSLVCIASYGWNDVYEGIEVSGVRAEEGPYLDVEITVPIYDGSGTPVKTFGIEDMLAIPVSEFKKIQEFGFDDDDLSTDKFLEEDGTDWSDLDDGTEEVSELDIDDDGSDDGEDSEWDSGSPEDLDEDEDDEDVEDVDDDEPDDPLVEPGEYNADDAC
jgi:hypothetical protein